MALTEGNVISIVEIKNMIDKGECILKNNINLYEAKRLMLDNKFEHIDVSVKMTE